MLKKVLTIFGRVELAKTHIPHHKAFKITVYVQSLMCLLGQEVVFESASQWLAKPLQVDVSAKQIQRVSHWYGQQIDPIVQSNHVEYMPQLKAPKDKEEHTYVMVDRSMLYTREQGWKENKLARLFHSGQNIDIQTDRNEVMDNVYVSHLGSADEFLPKVERHISLLTTREVFIADGAKWIWNWVEDNYPASTQMMG